MMNFQTGLFAMQMILSLALIGVYTAGGKSR